MYETLKYIIPRNTFQIGDQEGLWLGSRLLTTAQRSTFKHAIAIAGRHPTDQFTQMTGMKYTIKNGMEGPLW
jgi:hypothetical protein